MDRLLPEQSSYNSLTIIASMKKELNAQIKLAWEEYRPRINAWKKYQEKLDQTLAGKEFEEITENFELELKTLKADFKEENETLYQRLENLKTKEEIEKEKITSIILDKNRKGIPLMFFKEDKENRMLRLEPVLTFKFVPVRDKENKYISYGEYYRYMDEFANEQPEGNKEE